MNEELLTVIHNMTKKSRQLVIDGARDYAMYKGKTVYL